MATARLKSRPRMSPCRSSEKLSSDEMMLVPCRYATVVMIEVPKSAIRSMMPVEASWRERRSRAGTSRFSHTTSDGSGARRADSRRPQKVRVWLALESVSAQRRA